MDFEYSKKTRDLIDRIRTFIQNEIVPAEGSFNEQVARDPWVTPPALEALKETARGQGLWNLFLPKEHGRLSPGLTNLEYAPLAEAMGHHHLAPEVFNCSAPDTGNMEVLAKYGTARQQEQWLAPLMQGTIRSAFAMTEPAVASSDATHIQTTIRRVGDEYVINGHKFFISGANRKSCRILIVMGKTHPGDPDRHRQQSQILVPIDAPGITVKRAMRVLGSEQAPEGHADIVFDDVRVPADNIILGEGRGFEIAQGRLGPGRIHHCMRLVGAAQHALDLMCRRANQRVAFGQPLSQQGSVREDIAKSCCEIEQARLLTLKAADAMDRYGNKGAKDLIAMIKIVAPAMALRVIDRAIQIHGAVGLSQDTPLAGFFAYARAIRLADGPDQVHMMQLGRNLAKRCE